MIQVQDISEKLEFTVSAQSIEVVLQPNQYHLERLAQYKMYLSKKRNFLAGKITEASEKKLIISYQKDPLTTNLAAPVFKKLSIYERLVLTQKMSVLTDYLGSPAVPFIAPENLFIQGDQIVIGHRGFMDAIVPYQQSEIDYFKEYRALILYMINPDLEYSKLIQGAGTLETRLSQKLQAANDFAALNEILRTEVARQRGRRQANNKLVSKKRYMGLKWGSVILGTVAAASLITAGYLGFKKVPFQDRVIAAQTQFNSKNYDAVLNSLENDRPESLPKSAQYMAAVSSIKLDSLSYKQQRVLLNNVSQKSSPNTLLYWIYLGGETLRRV